MEYKKQTKQKDSREQNQHVYEYDTVGEIGIQHELYLDEKQKGLSIYGKCDFIFDAEKRSWKEILIKNYAWI